MVLSLTDSSPVSPGSALASSLVGESGPVVSIEPVAQTREWLGRKLVGNGCSNVEVFGVAAGEAGGVLRLGRVEGEHGNASAACSPESMADWRS